MALLWPWLVVAGAGALHGLNPCTGWMLLAARGVRSGDRRQALRALAPLALGHAASIGAVAGVVALQASTNLLPLQAGAGAALLVAALVRRARRRAAARPASPGHAGLVAWSFMASTLQGTGIMLVPALIPLCLANSPARAITASGSLGLALAAVLVHTAAMLLVSGGVALCACRAVDFARLRLGTLGALGALGGDRVAAGPARGGRSGPSILWLNARRGSGPGQ